MKIRNILIIIALALLFTGIGVCSVSVFALHFNLDALNTEKLVTREYDITESFDKISVDVDTDDLIFKKSTDGKCHVTCLELEDTPHDVKVSSGTLTVSESKNKKIRFFSIGFYKEDPTITVSLPEANYNSVLIKTDTGDLQLCELSATEFNAESDTGDLDIENLKAPKTGLRTDTGEIILRDATIDTLSVSTDTGDIKQANVSAESINISTDTGEIDLENVVASGDLDIKSDTGDVSFDGCDAGSIRVKTTTGSVSGSLLTDKVFLTESETGDISVPKTTTGGNCEVTTDTGDIDLEIRN